MKTFLILTLGLVTAALWAQEETEIHGNVKVGALLSPDLANSFDPIGGRSFLIDNTLVGRLGNEPGQSYGLDIVQNFPGLDGTWAKAHFTIEGYAMNFATAAYTANKSSNKTADQSTKGYNPYVTQAFVEMGGFTWEPKAALWVGTRYYAGDGIAISGFNYVDRSGAGFGVQGLLGGVVDAAVLTDDSLLHGNAAASVPLNGQLRVHFTPGFFVEAVGAVAADSSTVTAVKNSAERGVEVLASVDLGSFYGLPGTSRLVVQGGSGMFGNSESDVTAGWSQLGKLGSVWTDGDSYSLRALTYGLFTAGEFDVMPALWVQYDHLEAGRLTLSAAVRPVWRLDRTLSLLAEAGVADKIGGVKGAAADGSGNAPEGLAYKITLAPTLSLDSAFWGLPQLRLLASWQSQDARLGALGPEGETGSFWFGVQTEARW